MTADRPYWETKRLDEMSQQEWEALCDGCGRCCVHKLEDEEDGRIHLTDVACRLLDCDTCQCSNYSERHRFVPDCTRLTPERVPEFRWLPASCAYRRLHEGRGLAWWHPLVSGDPETVHEAGISVRGQVVSERQIDLADLEDRFIEIYPMDDPEA